MPAGAANCAAVAVDSEGRDISSSIMASPMVKCLDASSGTCSPCPLTFLQQGLCYPAR